MPSTATMAAIPMAIPRADRAARSRRVRSPVPATSSRSQALNPGALCPHLRGGGVALDAPVAQVDAAGQAAGNGRVVGDDRDLASASPAPRAGRARQHRWPRFPVGSSASTMAGRATHRPGDRDPLALTARQLGPGVQAVAVPNPLQRPGGAARPPARRCTADRWPRCPGRSSPQGGRTAGIPGRWSRPGKTDRARSDRSPTSWPATRTVPLVGRSRVPMTCSRVDLPDPLGWR